MGRIKAVCISTDKGTPKKDIGKGLLITDHGFENDAHAGSKRQVSMLSYEVVREFEKEINEHKESGEIVKIEPGAFGENLLVSGFDLKTLAIGTRFRIRDVILELTQIGKTCHDGCTIAKLTGKCIMPKEGVFVRVVQGGLIQAGDEITIYKEK